jgi:hypothetical protein
MHTRCHLANFEPTAERKLYALSVATVGGVHGDDVILVDEERNHDLGSGLEGDFLESRSRSGVTLDGRLCVGNLEGHVGRELAGKTTLFVCNEHHFDVLAFLHEIGVLHNIVREVDLLVGLFVHEVETVLVAIKELVGTPFDIDSLNLCTCGEGVFEDAAVLEVTEFGLDESRALAGFDVLEPYDHTRFTVEIQVEAVFEISCCCHI